MWYILFEDDCLHKKMQKGASKKQTNVLKYNNFLEKLGNGVVLNEKS